MSREDFIYLFMLFGAIPFGHLVKTSGSPSRKQFLTFAAGLFIVLSLPGLAGIPHSFSTILGTFLILKTLGHRYGPWSAICYVFGYLFFFRTCHWYGLPKPPPYSNAVQLLVTLRMCTIAFEGFQLSCRGRTAKMENPVATPTFQASLYDTFSYGYCYCGLLTAPYYRFTTYVDMLHQTSPENIPTFIPALKRIKFFPLLAAAYLPLNQYFPISHLLCSEYLNHSWGFAYRVLYLVPLFTWVRLRFYIGWLLAESSCIALGLGAYPEECKPRPGQGPTIEVDMKTAPRKYNFETIRNIKPWETEFAPTLRKTARTWNMTIQWWLVEYIYKKFPWKQHRMWATFLFSAFWHGVRPGYYLSFMSFPLIILAQTRAEKLLEPSANWQSTFDWVNWFILHRTLEYVNLGFILLDPENILRTWSHLYFYNHIFVIIFIAISLLSPCKTRLKSKNQ